MCLSVLCRTTTQLKLTIISGQHIPKANQDMEGEVVDPYVVVKIVGHPADAQKVRTDIIRNNGKSLVLGHMYVIVKVVGHPADAQKIVTDGELHFLWTLVYSYAAKFFAM